MKMMFARCCATLVVPHQENKVVRWCRCKESACWWHEGALGLFYVYNALGDINRVEGLGLHNGLLQEEILPGRIGCVDLLTIKNLIKETPGSYLFKQVESLIIKFRIGFTSDTTFISDIDAVPLTQEKAVVEQRSPS